MMKHLSLLICLTLSFQLLAQVKRKILDKETRLPVSYVTIKVLNSKKGAIGTADGEFNLKIERSDSVSFSCAGYNPIVVSGNEIDDKIYMTPNPIMLHQVIVNNKHYLQTIVIGNEKEISSGEIVWGPSPTSGSYDEFAQKIIIPDSINLAKIKKVLIPIKKQRCTGPLLLRIYHPDNTGNNPGSEVMNLLINKGDMPIKKKVLHIDLASANLFYNKSDSFYVSITWPPEAFSNKCITGLLLSNESISQTFLRSLNVDSFSWSLFQGQFSHKKDEYVNPKTFFAVEVDVY
jgi:hypothetical protein